MPFFDNLAKKNEHPKNTVKIGVSAFFRFQKICVTKRPFFDKKKQIQKFQLSFVLPIFFSFNKKNSRIC